MARVWQPGGVTRPSREQRSSDVHRRVRPSPGGVFPGKRTPPEPPSPHWICHGRQWSGTRTTFEPVWVGEGGGVFGPVGIGGGHGVAPEPRGDGSHGFVVPEVEDQQRLWMRRGSAMVPARGEFE